MASDAKITIPYHGNDPLILSSVGTSVTGVPLSTDDRLNQLGASVAALSASLSALITAGTATERLLLEYDGSTPSIVTDTYGGCTIANVSATTFRLTSAGLFTGKIHISNTYPDVGWVKEDTSNYLFELPDDYTGAAFQVKLWEESA